jgi:hypothetical protein
MPLSDSVVTHPATLNNIIWEKIALAFSNFRLPRKYELTTDREHA